MSVRSIIVKGHTDAIDAGVKRISEFGNDDYVPHLIICSNYRDPFWLSDSDPFKYNGIKTFKNIFLRRMRKNGMRSAILSIVSFRQQKLKTKEEVKEHLDARQNQLKEATEGEEKFAIVQRLLSEDLESLYTSLQNPEREPKKERVNLFLTQKLTEEQQTLLETRNDHYLKTFNWYNRPHWRKSHFNLDMSFIRESNDSESIFSRSDGERWTSALHVSLKSLQEEMRKRVSNEDLPVMELKKQRVGWYNRNEYTYKFVKKESSQ